MVQFARIFALLYVSFAFACNSHLRENRAKTARICAISFEFSTFPCFHPHVQLYFILQLPSRNIVVYPPPPPTPMPTSWPPPPAAHTHWRRPHTRVALLWGRWWSGQSVGPLPHPHPYLYLRFDWTCEVSLHQAQKAKQRRCDCLHTLVPPRVLPMRVRVCLWMPPG